MRNTLLAVACSLMLAAPALARQDGAAVTPPRDPGATMTYRLTAATTLDQQGERTAVRQEARLAFRISDDTIRDVRLVDVRLLELTITIDQGDESYEVVATRTEDGVDLSSEGAPDEVISIARAVADAAIRLGMAPDGRIVGVQGLASAASIADEAATTAGVALSVFYPEAIAGALEPIFFADDAGAAPRSPGDAWTVESDRPLGEGRTIVETLACVFEEGFSWTGDLTIAIEHDDDLPATTSRVEVTGQSGSVAAQWNAEAGMLERRVRTLATDLVWRLGDIEIAQRQETTLTLERLELDEPLPDDIFTPSDQAPSRRSIRPGG